jgi:hypothetical protein
VKGNLQEKYKYKNVAKFYILKLLFEHFSHITVIELFCENMFFAPLIQDGGSLKFKLSFIILKVSISSIISSNYVFKGLAFETLGPWCKEAIDFINVIGNRLIAESVD